MGEPKAEMTYQPRQQISSSSSPKDPLDQETPPPRPHHHHHQPFISSPFYIPIAGSSSSPFETAVAINPKRPRYSGSATAPPQWKPLPSPSSSSDQQKQTPFAISTTDTATNPISPPSTTTANPTHQPQSSAAIAAASLSETADSSPAQSPIPSISRGSGQEQTISKPETESFQFRKGKYVSPVWKPNEMLWLARAWRVQYQGGGWGIGSGENLEAGQSGRGKTRAEKDREVAEFLNNHGINRDAKTAGTKWDNMLGEFRKVYEWERGGEREKLGKSYFRLSPFEKKQQRLPASFDEDVFEELAQFMGPRMRAPTSRGGVGPGTAAECDLGRRPLPLPPPPTLREDDISLSSGREKQLALTIVGDHQLPYLHNTRGPGHFSSLYDPSTEPLFPCPPLSSSSLYKDLRRIGKIRMTWEESVSLWAEEGEIHRGRVRVHGSSFLNAEELTFFDDSMVACTMEAYEDGPLKGFTVDRFISGQQVKVFGKRKSTASASSSTGLLERAQPPFAETFTRLMPTWEFQDPTEHYLTCLRAPPTTLPSLFELSWHLQEPPPEDLRFPLRKDLFKDLPPGKELFFTTSSTERLDCRAITYDILSPIIRASPNFIISSRDSLISVWDDCVNRVVSKFCSTEMVMIRKPSLVSAESVQDQWPNVTGFVKNLCLWRGEEIDSIREAQADPSSLIVEKLFWSYADLPYILGYYAIGYTVTFCAMSRSQDRIIRTDLYSFDLSSPSDRIKALVPCYRLAGLLPLLAERCAGNSDYKQFSYSDFERTDHGADIVEMTPNTVTKIFSTKRKWTAVKEIYDFLDGRVPHAEYLHGAAEKDLVLTFKPRGVKVKPRSVDQLVEALKYVTKALVALHDQSFMHRNLSWDRVMRVDRSTETEWFLCGFDEAVSAPQINPHVWVVAEERGKHAPEMGRGLHGVKVDVWGVGYLVKTCGLSNLPKMLRELQNKCLEHNPEQRPTAADCYHHLLQVQSAGAPPY